MAKLNLSEAAKEILNASKQSAPKAEFGNGYKPTVKTPQQTTQELGTAGHKTTDDNYDATKGVPTATPPGATPPVGSEKFGDNPSKGSGPSDYNSQPQKTQGRKDLAGSPEGSEQTDSDRQNRKKTSLPSQTIPSNKGAVTQVEDYEEASYEEVMEDIDTLSEEDFAEKYEMSKEDALKIVAEDDSCDGDEDEDEDEKEKEEKAEKAKAQKLKMKEDIDAMLSGETLSEEFKQKASMIFEAAVESRVEEIAKELEEQFTQEFESALDTVKEDFSEKLDAYLDYVVENWMEENKLAVEKGLRTEIAEDFIGALRNVFVEHYIDIPEDKVDVVEELVSKVEVLESQVNEQMIKNIELKKSLSEQKKVDIVNSICEGLVLSQAEKVRSLAKNIEFVSEEDYAQKVTTLKESYYPNVVKTATSDTLNESLVTDDNSTTEVVDPLISAYAKKITKNLKF